VSDDGGMTGTTELARVLVVEDDSQLADMLTRLLTGEGYQVDAAADGQRGLHLGLTKPYDVIVLDRALPAMDGLDLLGRLRSRGVVTPVLVLSALANPIDRVAGLDAGAEDYLGKPFDVDELLARLRALRRRHLDNASWLPVPGGRLNLETREVIAGEVNGQAEPIRLSERECGLLSLLATRPGQVFARDQLRALVFPDAESDVVVDTYVHYLRRKVGRRVVSTVRGRGYQLGHL
jgi:two-component system response regulator QseB